MAPLLLFLNEVAGGRKLIAATRERAGDASYVVAVAPANRPTAGQITSEEETRAAARSRVEAALPVVVVAYFQFGVTPDFYWVIGAYLVIQVLDGNVLVPLLFSEAVDLHPVAIVIAVLFFGGIWGLWGVFFAIPLATMVNALLSAWPARDALSAS